MCKRILVLGLPLSKEIELTVSRDERNYKDVAGMPRIPNKEWRIAENV